MSTLLTWGPLEDKLHFMDRNLIRVGIGIILFIFVCYLIVFVTATPKERAVLEAAPPEWVNVSEPTQGFKGHFPSQPKTIIDTLPLPGNEGKATYYLYISTLPDDTTYMVKVIDFPDTLSLDKPMALLTKSVEEMLAKDKENILESKEEIDFAGEKALEFSFSNSLTKLKAITFIKKGKQYMVAYLARHDRFDETSFRAFVSDFTF